jgi:environmental stress-induced protein Ves
VLHLTAADAREVPWRNGRGVTRELARWPPASDGEREFDWRISAAPVDEPGPFSLFPGVERVLVVTAGAGLVLAHGEAAPRARVRRLEAYRFDGAWETTAELPHGPISDLNVMVRRGRARASVEAFALGERRLRETLPAGHAFVHVLAGRCTARVTGEEEPFELRPLDGLWARGLRGGEELELAGRQAGTELVLVVLAGP